MKRWIMAVGLLGISCTAFGAAQWGFGNVPISGVMIANDVRIDGVAPLAFSVGGKKFYVTEAATKAVVLSLHQSNEPVVVGYLDDVNTMWDPGDGKAYKVLRVHSAKY